VSAGKLRGSFLVWATERRNGKKKAHQSPFCVKLRINMAKTVGGKIKDLERGGGNCDERAHTRGGANKRKNAASKDAKFRVHFKTFKIWYKNGGGVAVKTKLERV